MTEPTSVGINIAGETKVMGDPETIAQAAQSIVDILQVGFESHADQSTIQAAFRTLAEMAPTVNGVTITGCTLETHNHLAEGDDR